jgi:sorting nexin-1/2
MPVHVP